MSYDKKMCPLPQDDESLKPASYGKKALLMALMCVALMLGILAIWLMTYSRETLNREVSENIVTQWGNSIYLSGPEAKKNLDDGDKVCPVDFNCDAEVKTTSLHRGIYEAEVFTANISMSGYFNRDSLLQFGDTIVLEVGLTTKQIVNVDALKIDGKEIQWSKSTDRIFAKVDLKDLAEKVEFSTGMSVRGSAAIFINQIGRTNSITINGEAPNPSFNGNSLPIQRSQRGGRFSAKWNDNVSYGETYTGESDYVGTKFLVGVDRYQKVERSMKYSFIIIILTFLSVFCIEILKKQPIPLLNYFLIGSALIIFYSLLLSFSELVPFGFAYLIASAMTVTLISAYLWKILRSLKLGLSIGAALSLMYSVCYIMLSISNYALLIGSLLLFFALAASMYASLKLKVCDR